MTREEDAMKVSELSSAQLNYWVAKAEGRQLVKFVGDACLVEPHIHGYPSVFAPSRSWEQAGPIIEREIAHVTRHGPTRWSALANGSAPGHGPTPLIAAMRAYVASKFGDEVPDEPQPVA